MSDREKAIDLALSQIEKQFGKGSIMRLGNDQPLPDVAAIPTGSFPSTWRLAWGECRGGASSRSSARNLRVKPPSRSISSPKFTSWAASPPSSMPSMPSISATRGNWG